MYENRAFDKLEPKSAGTFPAPNDQYRWSLEVSEVNFGPLTNLLLAQTAKSEDPNAGQATQLLKMFEKYLKDSVRRMKVTIEYPDGGKHSSLTFTELLVNYDAEFTGGI